MSYDRWARHYDLIYERLIDYNAQCEYIRSMLRDLRVPDDGRILDLGCGTGGHAIPLARMGYRLTGVDVSGPMVEIAKQKAGGLQAEFLQMDMRELALPEDFDASICMFGGFGHVVETTDIRRTFAGIHARLRDQAPFIFEYWGIGGTKSDHESSEEIERDGLRLVRRAHSVFDNWSKVLHIAFKFSVYEGDRLTEEFHTESPMRIYEPGEIDELLVDSGFEIVKSLDADGLYRRDVVTTLLTPVKHDTFRVLCVARCCRSDVMSSLQAYPVD